MSCRTRANQPTLPPNAAELLLECGRFVHHQVHRGIEIKQVSEQLQATPDHCVLALAFAISSDVLKLRAMVEDWSYERIACELQITPCGCGAASVALISPGLFAFIPLSFK